MEKVFFDELRSRIDDLQSQLDALRASLDEVVSESVGAPFTEPVDISLDESISASSDVNVASGLPADDNSDGSSERSERNLSVAELPAAEPESACREIEDLPEDDLPEPEAKPEVRKEKEAREVKLDFQWAKDIPGGPVANIISGISLNDRVLLINTLFKEDPMLFQNTIGAFNGMDCFGDACDYVQENFPDWNLSSETVYRLMMAVRRKLK